MTTKQAKLNKLAQTIVQDNICPELAESATQLVMGAGSLDAKIVFIGEAPGKKEDELGIPFVGASGRLLDEMLKAASLTREDVYVTNIVKYRPPENRDPSSEEKAQFLPILHAQLAIINPTLIVTLGRHSMNEFLPSLKIGEVHGVIHHTTIGDKRFALLPLYHPAAALYNGSMRETLFEDFSFVPSHLESITNEIK